MKIGHGGINVPLAYYSKRTPGAFNTSGFSRSEYIVPAVMLHPTGIVSIGMTVEHERAIARDQEDARLNSKPIVMYSTVSYEPEAVKARRKMQFIFIILVVYNLALTTLLYHDKFDLAVSYDTPETLTATGRGLEMPRYQVPYPFQPTRSPSFRPDDPAAVVCTAVALISVLGLWSVLSSNLVGTTVYLAALLLNFFFTVSVIPHPLYLLRYLVDVALFHTAKVFRQKLMCSWFRTVSPTTPQSEVFLV